MAVVEELVPIRAGEDVHPLAPKDRRRAVPKDRVRANDCWGIGYSR
jgi:hypothetical protein